MTVCVSGPVSKTLRDPVAVCVGGCSFSKTKSWVRGKTPRPPRAARFVSGPPLRRASAGGPAAARARPPPAARPRRARGYSQSRSV